MTPVSEGLGDNSSTEEGSRSAEIASDFIASRSNGSALERESETRSVSESTWLSGIMKCLSESATSVIRLSSCFGKRYLRCKGQFHVNKCFRCNCQAVREAVNQTHEGWLLRPQLRTMMVQFLLTENRKNGGVCATLTLTLLTLLARKKKERTNITLQLDVLFVSDSLSITWCEDQVEPSHKPNRKAYFQHFCAESCMKSYGCKLHPDQNFKLYKPAVKLHLSLITDPPLHRWYKREQSVLRCSKRNHSPSSTWKHGTHMWVSVRPFAHLLTDVLQEELPMHVKSPKKLKFPGRDKHNTLRLFCRYHFTAALKRLQPDHKSWLLSVLPRCHRDFGCHTLVLIPPRGQQTARGTEPLGELCQP